VASFRRPRSEPHRFPDLPTLSALCRCVYASSPQENHFIAVPLPNFLLLSNLSLSTSSLLFAFSFTSAILLSTSPLCFTS
jgi:hypothetical protein